MPFCFFKNLIAIAIEALLPRTYRQQDDLDHRKHAKKQSTYMFKKAVRAL